MKDYELLDMIGEVNEDYVREADGNVVRPRFRWKTLAACAACAALALGAYPLYQAANPPLHGFTQMDKNEALTEEGAGLFKAPFEEIQDGPTADSRVDEAPPVLGAPTAPGDASIRSDKGGGPGAESAIGGSTEAKGWAEDVPMQEAALWYDALLHTFRLEENPEWYGGAWIAGDQLLAVAIVDGFRTPELEAEIKEAAGEGAVLQFSTVKYSMEFLNGLMEPAARALEGSGLGFVIGVDVTANCLGVDLYSGGAAIPDDILARLAHLDPDGDAIRVQVFTEAPISPGGDAPLSTPSPGGRQEASDDLPETKEAEQPDYYGPFPEDQ